MVAQLVICVIISMCLSIMSTSSSDSDIIHGIDAFGLEPYQYEPDTPDTGAARGIVTDEDDRQRRIGNTEW